MKAMTKPEISNGCISQITNGCISPARKKPAAAAAVVRPAAAAATVAAMAVMRPAEAVGCDDDVKPEKPQLQSFAHGWRVRAAAEAAGAAGKKDRKAAIHAYGRVLYGSSDEDT